jgi:hypothetical protein
MRHLLYLCYCTFALIADCGPWGVCRHCDGSSPDARTYIIVP